MVPELDPRKVAVLTAIVRGYIRDGEPVGSKRIVEEHALGVSAATVRADMVALEEAGYLMHPHTSAGRIPTAKGYRFFVDRLAEATTASATRSEGLGPDQQALLDEVLGGAGDLEDLLRRASAVLSRLTRFAALVAAPRLDASRLKHVELVTLGATSVLAVLIADTGRVAKRVLQLDTPLRDDDVQRARHAVNGAAVGLRVADAPAAIDGIAGGAPAGLRGLIEGVADALRADLAPQRGTADHVFVGGAANMAAGHFQQLEEVRRVTETLEEQVLLIDVLRDALAHSDPGVRIGEELPLAELAACSVVVTAYDATGATGSVGVLGPTRMDYPRTLAAVQAVASTLERAVADLTGSR